MFGKPEFASLDRSSRVVARPTGVISPGRLHGLALLAALAVMSFSACSSGSSAASVAPDPIVSVAVEPPDLLLLVNDEGSLDATARTQRGRVSSKPVTWTTSDPLIALVDGNGNVTGIGDGSAIVVAEVDGVADSAAVEIRIPPPPPPASGLHFRADFSAVADDAELGTLIDVRTPDNVHAQRGVGMRYDFIARPNHCNDQSLSSVVGAPTGTKEVWMRFRIRFSNNWSTVNSNCGLANTSDYKTVLTWLDKFPSGGGERRFDFKSGHDVDELMATVPGYPTQDVVPMNVIQLGGQSSRLYDGQWHVVEIHQALLGDDRAMVQIRIDNTVVYNYDTKTATGLTPRWIRRINIGANRNVGATSLMHVWWDDFEIWVGSTNPGFTFPSPTRY